MIAVEGVKKESIRNHYQLGTLFYRLLWGPHIHHGLWRNRDPAFKASDSGASIVVDFANEEYSGEESPYQAQCQLTDTLADLAKIKSGDRVVDIGCGMGGSAIRLAKQRQCDVTGVTLSSVQSRWATISSKLKSVGDQTRFMAEDAEKVVFEPSSFDVMWCVECTEHLFDKPAFFKRAAQWLRPGGRMAICVWFEGEDTTQSGHRQKCEEVCQRFVCPSLATRDDYVGWMEENGLQIQYNADWTDQVTRTWEICKRRVGRTGVRHLARVLDREHVDFIDGFDALLEAYRSGAMQYGAIVAEKPIA